MNMQPGIYEDLPFEDYLAIDAVSNTRLGSLAKSPRHYRFAMPLERAKYLVVGSLVHAGRLEPMAIAQRYAVAPEYHLDAENKTKEGAATNSKVTNYVKGKLEEFAGANEDKEIVPAEWYREVKSITESLFADPEANRLLNAPGPVELTMVWDDPETGIRCKGRIDKVCSDLAAFCDLKTTVDLGKFERSIANYGYHRQLAHYQAGYAVLTGELLTPWVSAVEKEPPFCVQTAPLDAEALAIGEASRRELLTLLSECMESDCWPGPPSPKSWGLPAWATNNQPVAITVGGITMEI